MYPARVAWAAAAARDDCASLSQDVRDVAVHGVLAEDERRRDLAVREPCCDEAQHLRLAPAERRRAVRLRGRRVVEEPRERALEVSLVVLPGQVRVARERDEARVRQQRGELAPAADRHRAVAPSVKHERRRRHAREERPGIGREVELEERGGDVGVRRVALVAAERLDLLAAPARHEQAGEHLRGEHPVHAREVDERASRRIGDVVARRVAAEEDDLAHALRRFGREPGGREPGARAREQRRRPVGARVEHRRELRGLGLGSRRPLERTVGEPCAEPVVADDPMRPGEALEERARIGVVPLLLEVRHPSAAEEQERPLADARVCDTAPVELAEADVLLHHPRS